MIFSFSFLNYRLTFVASFRQFAFTIICIQAGFSNVNLLVMLQDLGPVSGILSIHDKVPLLLRHDFKTVVVYKNKAIMHLFKHSDSYHLHSNLKQRFVVSKFRKLWDSQAFIYIEKYITDSLNSSLEKIAFASRF